MKALRYTLLAGAALAVTAFAAPASAESLASPALVRSGPGIQWPVFAKIPAGADVDLQGCYAGWEGGWCQVQYGKIKGFVQVGALAPSGANKVIVAPVVTNDLANLRKGPGTRWESVAVIPPSTVVNVQHCSQGWLYGWCKVSYEGKTGFVNGLLLQRQNAPYPTTFY